MLNLETRTLLKDYNFAEICYTQFFYNKLLYKQQGFKNLQIKQYEGFKIWN